MGLNLNWEIQRSISGSSKTILDCESIGYGLKVDESVFFSISGFNIRNCRSNYGDPESENCLSCPSDCSQCKFNGWRFEYFSGSIPLFNPLNETKLGSISSLPKPEIFNFMQDKPCPVSGILSSYVKIPNNGDYSFKVIASNMEVNSDRIIPLLSTHYHYITLYFFSISSESRNISLLWRSNEKENYTLVEGFYSLNICKDGILDPEEKLGGKYPCPIDMKSIIPKDPKSSYCGDGVCTEEPNTCIQDCYLIVSPKCEGIGHLRHGVDILSGSQKESPIFSFEYCDNSSFSTIHDFNRGFVYTLPKEVFASISPKCSYNTETTSYATSQEMSVDLAEKSAYLLLLLLKASLKVAYSKEESVEKAKQLEQKDSGSIVRTELKCSISKAHISDYKFSREFLKDISVANTDEKMDKVIQKYGSMYYKNAILGGTLTQVTLIKSSYTRGKDTETIKKHTDYSFSGELTSPILNVKASYSESLDNIVVFNIGQAEWTSFQFQLELGYISEIIPDSWEFKVKGEPKLIKDQFKEAEGRYIGQYLPESEQSHISRDKTKIDLFFYNSFPDFKFLYEIKCTNQPDKNIELQPTQRITKNLIIPNCGQITEFSFFRFSESGLKYSTMNTGYEVQLLDYSFSRVYNLKTIYPTSPIPATEVTYYVDNNSKCTTGCGERNKPFKTIGEAIKMTQDCDSWYIPQIVLSPGTYKGSLNKDLDIKNPVKIRSIDGFNNTIIDCEDTSIAFNVFRAKQFNLEGVTIQRCNSLYGGAIRIEQTDSTIKDFRFLENNSTQDSGALYLSSATANIYSSNFECNSVGDSYSKNRNDLSCDKTFAKIDQLSNIKNAGFSCSKTCTLIHSTTKKSLCQNPSSLCQPSNSTNPSKPETPLPPGSCSKFDQNIPLNYTIGDKICHPIFENCLTSPNDCLSCYFKGVRLSIFSGSSLKNITLLSVEKSTLDIQSFMKQSTGAKGSIFAYFKVPSSDYYQFRLTGSNIGVKFLVNTIPVVNSFYQQNKVDSHEKIYLESNQIHTINGEFFSFSPLPRNLLLTLIGKDGVPFNPFFYSRHICGDGILDSGEECQVDTQKPILNNILGTCTKSDPNEDFINCYQRLTKTCPSRQVPPKHLSPGFKYSNQDTIGNLISNQFIWHLPGSEHMSFGVNIINGEESPSRLFYFGYCDSIGSTLIEDVFRGRVYDIPKEFNAKSLPERKFSTNSTFYKDTESMAQEIHRKSTNAYSFSADAKIPVVKLEASAAFQKEKSVQNANSIRTSNENKLIVTELRCTTSVIQMSDNYSFHPLFLQALSKVVDIEDMINVISRFGTHFYKKSIMGGKLLQVTSSSSIGKDTKSQNDWKESSKRSFAVGIGSKFLGGSASATETQDSNLKTEENFNFQKDSKRTQIITYGGSLGAYGPSKFTGESNFENFGETVDLQPVPVDYDLMAIRNIIPLSWNLKHRNARNLWIDWTYKNEEVEFPMTTSVPIFFVNTNYKGEQTEPQMMEFQYFSPTDFTCTNEAFAFEERGEDVEHLSSYRYCIGYRNLNQFQSPYIFHFKAPNFFGSSTEPIFRLHRFIHPNFLKTHVQILSWHDGTGVLLDKSSVWDPVSKIVKEKSKYSLNLGLEKIYSRKFSPVIANYKDGKAKLKEDFLPIYRQCEKDLGDSPHIQELTCAIQKYLGTNGPISDGFEIQHVVSSYEHRISFPVGTENELFYYAHIEDTYVPNQPTNNNIYIRQYSNIFGTRVRINWAIGFYPTDQSDWKRKVLFWNARKWEAAILDHYTTDFSDLKIYSLYEFNPNNHKMIYFNFHNYRTNFEVKADRGGETRFNDDI
eukprot:gene11916-14571_t